MPATANSATAWAEQFRAFERNGAADAPHWLADLRRAAFAAFERDGFPTDRRGNEPWKYTNVRPIAESVFTLAEPDGDAPIDLAPYELPCPRVHRLTFVDGRYAPHLSTEPASEAGLRSGALHRGGDGPVIGRLADAIGYRVPLAQERLGSLASPDDDAFTALNTAFLRDGAFVHLPPGVVVPEPIHLLFIATGRAESATHPRVLISADENSAATVLTSFESLDDEGAYLANAVTEADVGPGANLRLCALQRESAGAFHIAATRIRQARGSRVSSVVVDLGARLARREISAALEEPGAEVSLCGLYYGDGKRHVDNRAFVDHAAPEAASLELYKGVLDGASRGVFCGGALVRPGAQKTSARQVNKNLLLSDDAEADSQPKLEIFADDVSCSHGSAVGQPDADALFYLKSRGIGEDAALALIARGFMSEVVAAIEDEAARQRVEDAVAARLGGGA